MVNICISLLQDLIIGIIAYIYKNPITFIALLVAVVTIVKGIKKFMGLFLMIIDLLKDTIDVGTFGISTPITIFVSLGIGIGWAAMSFQSPINKVFASVNSIPMFVFGTTIGIIQAPFLAIFHLLAGFGVNNRKVANFMGIISIAALYAITSISLPLFSSFCQGLDYVVNLF